MTSTHQLFSPRHQTPPISATKHSRPALADRDCALLSVSAPVLPDFPDLPPFPYASQNPSATSTSPASATDKRTLPDMLIDQVRVEVEVGRKSKRGVVVGGRKLAVDEIHASAYIPSWSQLLTSAIRTTTHHHSPKYRTNKQTNKILDVVLSAGIPVNGRSAFNDLIETSALAVRAAAGPPGLVDSFRAHPTRA